MAMTPGAHALSLRILSTSTRKNSRTRSTQATAMLCSFSLKGERMLDGAYQMRSKPVRWMSQRPPLDSRSEYRVAPWRSVAVFIR